MCSGSGQGRHDTNMRMQLTLVDTTCEPVWVQELDFAVLHESQLLDKLLQFADQAVRLLTAQIPA